jgi:hypothetical protein
LCTHNKSRSANKFIKKDSMKTINAMLFFLLLIGSNINCSIVEEQEIVYNTSWYSLEGEKYYEVYLFSDSSISFYEKPFGYSSVYSTEYIDEYFNEFKLTPLDGDSLRVFIKTDDRVFDRTFKKTPKYYSYTFQENCKDIGIKRCSFYKEHSCIIREYLKGRKGTYEEIYNLISFEKPYPYEEKLWRELCEIYSDKTK